MAKPAEVDLWRDTWLRYLGYANELGESLRPLVRPKVVHTSYGIAIAYTIADTADKSWKALFDKSRPRRVAVEAGDALIWQTLASVAVPGFIINRLSAYTRYYLAQKYPRIKVTARNWIAVAVSLVCIPIIVHPIDHATTVFMDKTYRVYFKTLD